MADSESGRTPALTAGDRVVLPPLPYALTALEPHISRRTLAEHHGQHHAAYVEKTRSIIKGTALESASLEDIVSAGAARGDSALFNAAAQAWNHAFYWRSLRPGGGGEARGAISNLIEDCFGRHRDFCEEFVTIAGDQFGSGWAWLVLDGGRLRITTTSNAGTPLLTQQLPLLVIDVWEHAYYFDYQHRRLDYIEALVASLVDWDFANHNLHLAPAPGGDRADVR
ncbi:MAG: superoxide dismutase [Steroidobacteraceae bacterium]